MCEDSGKEPKTKAGLRAEIQVKLPATCSCPNNSAIYRRSYRKWCSTAVCVRILWAGLSVGVTFACIYSLTQPKWLTNDRRRASFGLYNYCARDSVLVLSPERTSAHSGSVHKTNISRDMSRIIVERDLEYVAHFRYICAPYGGRFRLAHLPSNAWQVACVLYGGGSVLLGFGALAAVSTSLMADWWAARLASYTGYIQTMGVLTCAGGLVTFPLGLGAGAVSRDCPGAGMYQSGQCDVGWAFLLAIMSTAVSVFCPFLSQYIALPDKQHTDIYL